MLRLYSDKRTKIKLLHKRFLVSETYFKDFHSFASKPFLNFLDQELVTSEKSDCVNFERFKAQLLVQLKEA